MIKIGFIVLCRYSSSRLPGKILKTIHGKPILAYIFERLNCAVDAENIVIATSEDDSDNPIVEYCQSQGFNYFRGDLQDVSLRFLNCALENNFEYAVRINGDNLFTSPQVIQSMLPFALQGQYDFISNVKDRTFPIGMSVEFVRIPFYKEIIQYFDAHYQEHVTLYLYQNEHIGKRYYFYNTICPQAQGVKLAIDTEADFALAEKLLSNLPRPHTEYDLCDWVDLIK